MMKNEKRCPGRRGGAVHFLILACCLAAASCAVAPPAATDETDYGARLHALFQRDWEYRLQENPTFASHLGDLRYNHLWRDLSPEAIERRHRHARDLLAELDGIPVERLSETDRLNYLLFRKDYEEEVESHAFRDWLRPLTQRGGIQTSHELADSLRFSTVKDYEDWIARLESFPALMNQTIALMREGIRSGILQPRIVMERMPNQIAAHLVDDPAESLFYKPFRAFPEAIPGAEQERLRRKGLTAVSDGVVPAFRRLAEFFNGEYLPACPDEVGLKALPNGRAWYAFEARSYTTTSLTPEEIHAIGMREVARIRAEMEEIIRRVEFQGSFEEFLHFLRTDPQFYYQDPEDLLEAYRALAKRIDPAIVRLFGRLPRMPYGVEAVPDHIAPDTTTAYYRRPAADGSRAGTYFVNLYQPETRPKYEMEALSIHEAVPGHHLQIALAMELGELPDFRRYTGYTAFVEGWALYSESLGGEMGFYQDPYSKFGQLTYEMWRAVRLVVDTGMHHLGWTRQQAIDFFLGNAAKSEADVINEIDRYISWPGQALAYKIGELRIKELRALAQRELGERFDIRAFHDRVLENGAVPLDVLETLVREWIAQNRADG
jgi:uncharacterized protein (DUF885 family)